MPNIETFFKIKKTSKNKPMKKESDLPLIQSGKATAGAKPVLLMAGIVLILASLGTAGYFYWQYKKAVKNPQVASTSEAREITEKIGKFMELPEEEPTLATVADKEKLKDQSFFAKAQNGDKVLIFSKTGRAIIYRPSTEKVIEVTALSNGQAELSQKPAVDAAIPVGIPAEDPVETEPSAEPETTQPEATEAPKIAQVTVYNGTNQKSLAKNIAGELSAVSEINVISTGNAKSNYDKNLIVDLNGNNSEIVQKIIEKIGGEAGAFPMDEIRPEGDILIIGGIK